MNTGAFGEGFPYTNFHELNMDWIIKIAKDFLDQYSTIQETLNEGLQSLENATSSGITSLEEKKTELEGLLNAWYNTHSEDIAGQLATALGDLTTAYNSLISQLNAKGAEVLESIPDDYSALGMMAQRTYNEVTSEEVKTAKDTGARVPEGTVLSTSNMSGTLTNGKAWRTTGTPSSGSQYAYKLMSSQSGNAKKMILVTGNSWGEQYPLVTFYDSSDNIIGYYGIWGNTVHEEELVTIPNGTDHFYINGKSDHEPQAKLIDVNFQYMFGNVVKPFCETINDTFVTAHSEYNDIRNYPNNYIYPLGASAYGVVNNLPEEFRTNGCLIKFNPNLSPYSNGYTAYILMSETDIWNGYDTSTKVVWHKITNPTGEDIPFGFDYIAGVYTDGKAKHINGSEGSNSAYIYATFTVTGGETYLVDGWQYASAYPAYIIYDSNDTVIGQSTFANSSGHRNVQITLPDEAVKMIVNGYRTTSADYYMPAVKYYGHELSEYRSNIIKKRYLFIGDSYAQGYSHDGGNVGWVEYCAQYMGLESDQYVKALQGGIGFATGTTFTDMLVSSRYASDYFTDIVVAGGFNDWSHSVSDILAGIENFMTRAKQIYPNAKVHIGCIAYIKQGNGEGALSNYSTIRYIIEDQVIPSYQKCTDYGAIYMVNTEYTLSSYGLTPSDGYHPSDIGNQSIGRGIANAIQSGSACHPYYANLRSGS